MSPPPHLDAQPARPVQQQLPRPPRIVVPDFPHHVTQRGNYRQKVFFRDEDRRLYIDLLREFSRHYGVSILAYCLMSNHVHLIAVPHEENALARLLQRVQGDYARALHMRLRRTGHLWQARYHSFPMDDKHLWAGMVYIEQNPSRAGLVKKPWEWRWSSATRFGRSGDERSTESKAVPTSPVPPRWLARLAS